MNLIRKKFSKETLILLAILILAACFRFYNINWDQGFHMHPDERAIAITVDKLKFPSTISEFLSPTSSWNPNFFAYGSFPMYLLRFAGDFMGIFNPLYAQYTSINLIGRAISALSDILTVVIIFKLSKKLFNEKVGLFAAFFYAVSVLPIQLSHFYAVDTLLTLFVTSTLYMLILFYEKPKIKTALVVGILFGFCLATKVSALVLIASILVTLLADFLLIFLKSPHKPKHYLPRLPKSIIHLIKYGLTIGLTTAVTFLILEPYALIDFKNFWEQNQQQSTLTKDPFYFPYTLQFVGKIPYIYEIKNMFLWGLGPILGFLAIVGAIYFFVLLVNKEKKPQFAKELIIFIFFIVYFGVIGKFAVGFMRYMMPIYPIFTIFAAILVYDFLNRLRSKNLRSTTFYLLLAICLIWPSSFIQIYKRPNTRTLASLWIYQHIPLNKTLAVEHWDDQLPIGGPSYQTQTLKLYDPDTDIKWAEINNQLAQTDYIVIASNRLYVPLQKLTDCAKLPPFKCYPKTADYYKKLFSGKLGFKEVAEFTSFPTIPILNFQINDQSADENFTVFDHPKVMIFKKTYSWSRI